MYFNDKSRFDHSKGIVRAFVAPLAATTAFFVFGTLAHATENTSLEARSAKVEQQEARIAKIEKKVDRLSERLEKVQVRGGGASADDQVLTPSERMWQHWERKSTHGN